MDNKEKQLEEIAGQLSDGYCKFPTLISDEDKLDEVCMKCPLNQIFELLKGGKANGCEMYKDMCITVSSKCY